MIRAVWLLFFISSIAFASAKNEEISIQILHGELKTVFKIDPGASTVSITNSNGFKKTRLVEKENMKYIVAQVDRLPMAKHLPGECARAKMEVIIGMGKTAKHKSSCFGMKSITSQKYQDLANLLAIEI